MSVPQPPAIAALRRAVSALESGCAARKPVGTFRLGYPPLDEALGGGLARGALHEVYAERQADAAAAAGFGLGLASRAASGRPVAWVRQDFVAVEAGQLHGAGIAAFGLDPGRLLVVRARDPTGVLRAAAEAVACSALGTVLLEIWGEPKVLDLRASRRLALAAEASGVTLLTLRLGAAPAPSAATTRWSLKASASMPLEANAPGRPAFAAALLRHRSGLAPRSWRLEWDRDRTSFAEPALPRPLVPVPANRPAAAGPVAQWRRAG